jgi:hypothetical protein
MGYRAPCLKRFWTSTSFRESIWTVKKRRKSKSFMCLVGGFKIYFQIVQDIIIGKKMGVTWFIIRTHNFIICRNRITECRKL